MALCVEAGSADVRDDTFRRNGYLPGPPAQVACPTTASDAGATGEVARREVACADRDEDCWRTWQAQVCRSAGTTRALVVEGGRLLLANSTFEDNAVALWASTDGSLDARRNVFRSNERGVELDLGGGGGPIVLASNVFEGHGDAEAAWNAPWWAALQVGARSDAPRPGTGNAQDVLIAGNEFRGNNVGIGLGGDARGVRFVNNTVVGNGIGLANEYGYATLQGGVFENVRYDLWLWGGSANVELRSVIFDPAKVRIDDERSVVVHDGGELRKATLVAAAFALLASAAVALTEAGRWLMLKSLFALGYTRLRGRELPDQSTRNLLLGRIAEQPGTHLRQLARDVGSYGNAVYHLRVLEREGLVRSVRDGMLRRFYPAGPVPASTPLAPLARGILALVDARPGIAVRDLSRELGCSRQLVDYHVSQLVARGFIARNPGGALSPRRESFATIPVS
ncbi:MAG: winged helix-turn-helix transcriptional regulator [Halobacteriales archaeon]|nr:winged helix-turn-helix transcriptional regulator [Halobacteriales archaeon]